MQQQASHVNCTLEQLLSAPSPSIMFAARCRMSMRVHTCVARGMLLTARQIDCGLPHVGCVDWVVVARAVGAPGWQQQQRIAACVCTILCFEACTMVWVPLGG